MEPDWKWADCQRHGIRGATEREIVGRLTGRDARGRRGAEMLNPLPPHRDRVALWRAGLSAGRREKLKSAAGVALRVMYALTGTVVTQNMTLAVRKR